jgi:hypothetical protein
MTNEQSLSDSKLNESNDDLIYLWHRKRIKASSLRIWGTKNLHKLIKNEKAMSPQNKGGSKK